MKLSRILLLVSSLQGLGHAISSSLAPELGDLASRELARSLL